MKRLSIKHTLSVVAAGFAVAMAVAATPVTASAASTALVEWDGTAAEDFAGGTGTQTDPYLISNGQELAYFVEYTYYLADNTGEYFKLTSDILLNDSFDDSPNKWVNENGVGFEGILDGDGHTIYGLYQDGYLNTGIVGVLDNAGVIKNLNVADAYITNASMRSGIVCGHNRGTIINCTSSGYIHGNSTYLGGVCGSVAIGTVEDCINYATVESKYQRAGGITGAITDGASVKNCYNAGDVNGTSAKDSYQTGGICGYLEGGSISGCGNIADVSSVGRGVGGVVGMVYDNCTITNCYNTGDVSGTYQIGGVWGYMNNTAHSASYCYNAGDVVATDSNTIYEYQIGPIVDGCVNNVYYDGNVCTAADSTNAQYAKTTSQLTASAVITNLGFDSKVWGKTANTSTFLRYPNLSEISVDDPKIHQGTAVNISTATISAIQDQGYAAVALTPEVIVTMGTERLVEGRDYTIAYSNNINIGTATVKVTGKGDYTGTKSAIFKIVAKPAGGLIVPEITGQVFTGSALKPSFKVYNGTKLLTSGTDYTYTYSDNINAGEGTITLTGKGSYTDTKTVKFEIDEKDISLLTFPAIPDQYYDFGNTIWPDITLTDGSYVLKEGTDYNYQGVSGGNNKNIGAAKFKVYGRGNYDGTVELSFNIVPIPADQFVVSDIAVQMYTGSAITPSFTVKGGGRRLTEGTHYTVAYSNNTNVGTATITLTGLDYFTGTKKVTFAIRKDITATTVSSIADQAYTGSAITPAVTVKDGSTTLTKGTHYTVAYSNNTNAGTATVTITGKGDYTGTKTVTFKIVKSISNATVSAIADQSYTGNAIKPAVTVKDGSTTLKNGTDYTVAYSNNTEVGTATVTITGKGNYTGTKTTTFKILRSLSNASFSAIFNKTYTGSAITPEVTVRFGATELTLNTDYTVAYSDNINVGTATVTATGKGNYTGTKTTTFNITAKQLYDITVSTIADQPYTGSAITPTVTVKDGSRTLVSGTDYTVEYTNNTALGKATVTITGIGNYTGTKTAYFKIVAKDINDTTVSSIAAQTYTGSALTPAVTIKNGSVTLENGTDYTVAYSNNVNLGTATVTITGIGNYKGTKTVNFSIVKAIADVSVASIADQTYTGSAIKPAVTVKDGSTTLESGTHYTVTYSNNTNVGSATVTITGKGIYTGTKTATFKIVAKSIGEATVSSIADQIYTGSAITPAVTVTLGGVTLTNGSDYTVAYSNNTNAGTATVTITGKGNYTGTKTANFNIITLTLDAPDNFAASVSGNVVALRWNAVSDATSYRVYRATSSSGTKTLLKAIAGTTYTDNTAEQGKTYYYYVAAYNSSIDILSDYSSVSVTIPAAPTISSVTQAKGKINIAWSAVSGATSYRVYRATSATGTKTLLKTVGITSCEDTTATFGTTYYYFVQAYSSKTGATSAYSGYKSLKFTSLAPPTLNSVTTDGTAVNLSWSAVPNATSYRVYRGTSATGAKSLLKTVSITSCNNTSVTAGTTYYYYVVAYSSKTGTMSAASNTKSVTIASSLSAPTLSSVTQAKGKVNIAWNAVSGATSYKVYRATSATGTKTLLKTVGITSCTDTTATLGTTYYYFVQAYSSKTATTSDFSGYKSLKFTSIAPPTLNSVTTDGSKVTLSWSAVPGATSYRVYRGTSATGAKTLLKTVSTTSCNNTSVTAGATYYYYVAAYSSKTGTLSAASNTKSITV